jgi:hypothetical protein
LGNKGNNGNVSFVFFFKILKEREIEEKQGVLASVTLLLPWRYRKRKPASGLPASNLNSQSVAARIRP